MSLFSVVQWNNYYPFGMSFGEETDLEQGKQNFKYNGKELDKTHGLDQYDYATRFMDPGMIRFTTVDPHVENYFSWNPYVYVGNNPMRLVDPDGKDWWSTNDPKEINKIWTILTSNRVSNNEFSTLGENFNTSLWDHVSDQNFVAGLSFNDENQTFFTSYVSKEGNDYVVNGISISATSFNENSAYVESDLYKSYKKYSGRIDPINIEFAKAMPLTSSGWKAVGGLVKFLWNTMSGGYNTTNAFDAGKSGFAFKGGKQSARDASIKQYPIAFQR